MNQFKVQPKKSGFIICVLQTTFILVAACCSLKAAETNNVPKVSLTETNTPEQAWNTMKSCLTTNNIQGAVACFSVASKEKYEQAFSSMSRTDMVTYVKGLGSIKKASMDNDKAQYYFENVIDGKTITFPVEFDKENGAWKIVEF